MIQKPLTLISSHGGCASKAGPNDLGNILGKLILPDGLARIINNREDAGVVWLDNHVQIVQSIDVITPVSDDPWILGGIATAHALSDLYAVGARPITGLFFLGFPTLQVSTDTAGMILQGAIDKLNETTASILGGHTIISNDLQIGLAATGIVEGYPITNTGCKEGDILVLTKPIGSGIIVTAQKLFNDGVKIIGFSKKIVEECQDTMLELNSKSSKAMINSGVHACTDVSGFSLIGHLIEMLASNQLSAEISLEMIPIMSGALDFASQEIFSAGCDRNMAYWRDRCEFMGKSISHSHEMILFDPQTSGGLLISVPENNAQKLLNDLKNAGVHDFSIIGQITQKRNATIIIKD